MLTLEEAPTFTLEQFPVAEPTELRREATALPTASVIIVNMNGREHLERCLPAIVRQDYDNCEIILIDNASTDGSCDYVARAFPEVRIIRNDDATWAMPARTTSASGWRAASTSRC
ncbi:MAG: glycosyltransferase [Thermomicrobiales bacterium]